MRPDTLVRFFWWPLGRFIMVETKSRVYFRVFVVSVLRWEICGIVVQLRMKSITQVDCTAAGWTRRGAWSWAVGFRAGACTFEY